jgi:AcrR family transcriptional regulator
MTPSTESRATVKSRGRGRPARTHPPRRREREILDAAAEMFRRYGYADTSIQDVAEAVGILKGSLYYYIDSKEDLLYRVLLQVHEDSMEIMAEIAAMTDVSPLERIAAYVRRHVTYNATHTTKAAVYYHDFSLLSPERRSDIRRHRKLYEAFLDGLVRDAQESGEIDPAFDTRVLTYCMFGTMNWTFTWYRPGGRLSVNEVADMIAEFVIDGLRRRPDPHETSNGRRAARAAKERSNR